MTGQKVRAGRGARDGYVFKTRVSSGSSGKDSSRHPNEARVTPRHHRSPPRVPRPARTNMDPCEGHRSVERQSVQFRPDLLELRVSDRGYLDDELSIEIL